MPAVKLSPLFNDQAVTSSGAPASGYKVYSYAAGSSTPLATYTDSTGNSPQNPVVLNANGFPTNGQIWLQSGVAYKLVFTDANDVVIKTEDNIAGVNDTTSTVNQFQSSGVTPTYVNTTSFTLPGDQTSEFHLGRRLQFSVTSGTVYGTIIASAYASLTTITVAMDDATVLDSGLSSVNLSILRADKKALPAPGVAAVASGTADALIGAFVPAVTSLTNGLKLLVKAISANATTTPTFKADATTAKTIVKGNNLPLAAGDIAGAGHWLELTYDSTLDRFVLGNPASPVSTVLLATSINGGPLAGLQNLLINPTGFVNQRGYASGAATTSAYQYTVDRWRVVTSGQNLSWTFSGNACVFTAPVGGVEQIVEAGNVAAGPYTLSWTGTATATVNGAAVLNGGRVTLPGNTSVSVVFFGGTFSLPMLQPGTRATPFEPRPYQLELMLCQRYYETGSFHFAGYGVAGNPVGSTAYFKVTKRAIPTMTLTPFSYANASTANTTNITVDSVGLYGVVSATGGATGYINWIAFCEL